MVTGKHTDKAKNTKAAPTITFTINGAWSANLYNNTRSCDYH